MYVIGQNKKLKDRKKFKTKLVSEDLKDLQLKYG